MDVLLQGAAQCGYSAGTPAGPGFTPALSSVTVWLGLRVRASAHMCVRERIVRASYVLYVLVHAHVVHGGLRHTPDPLHPPTPQPAPPYAH